MIEGSVYTTTSLVDVLTLGPVPKPILERASAWTFFLPWNFCHSSLVKVRLIFTYLAEILDHLFTLSLGKSLNMAYHYLRIASNFYVLCSHLPGYREPGQHGLMFGFIVGGNEVQLDRILKFFTIRACKDDTDSTFSVS
jgi:hypothetical protein